MKSKRGQQQQAKNELCFSTPADKFKNEEFDFEKNLALFDKQVYNIKHFILHCFAKRH